MSDEDARTVWVGNLDPGSVSDEILYELFLQAGPLQFVRHAKDKASGEKKTFAFVCYRSESAVPYAIELFNGIKLFGRPMKVKNRDLEELQRKQGRGNRQLMGEGIHTLCPTEISNQQPYNNHGGSQSHRGNQALSQEMQQQMMLITAAGLMGNNPLLGGGMMLGNNQRMSGGGGMMPSRGYQPSHMSPSRNHNNRNDGRSYGGGSSRYLDNDSMKNIKKQFDRSDRSSHNVDNQQQARNFNYNRLGPRVEDALGGPVGRGNDYNRSRQNDFNQLDPHVENALGGPIGKGNDYNRSRQIDYYDRNLNDRNNGNSPDGRRDNRRDNYSRHDNRQDHNRGDHNRGHQHRNSPYDRHSRR
ncbi:unnamed protein product [Meganyctiphanes norvegica]|uniref:RRM domain-containing protein n=1 Tax=Meganyctiphanes norvegica TaxID=48144 RepID=A0AAV2REN7_MEGNR